MDHFNSILKDYYLRRLSNEEMFSKYEFSRSHENIRSERVYEAFSSYKHDLNCEHCGCSLTSRYRGKNAKKVSLVVEIAIKDSELARVAPGLRYQSIAEDIRFSGVQSTPDGYKVDFPMCSACGHRPARYCSCIRCKELQRTNYVKAVRLVQSEMLCYSLGCLSKMNLCDLHQTGLLLFHILKAPEVVSGHYDFLTHKPKEALVNAGILSRKKSWLKDSLKMTSIYEYIFEPKKIRYTILDKKKAERLYREARLAGTELVFCRNRRVEIFEMWEHLASREALAVVEFYCKSHSIEFNATNEMKGLIVRGLKEHGLALTCRYICNSFRRARTTYDEGIASEKNIMNEALNNLRFWLFDQRAKGYKVFPFIRKYGVLSEPDEVTVFSMLFLEPLNLNYFSDPLLAQIK